MRRRGFFALILSFCSSCDYKPRYHQSWALIPAPVQVFTVVALPRLALFPQSLPLLTRAIPSMSRGPLGEQFLVVDHTTNIIVGAKVSGIWHHGGERRRTLSKPVSA